MTSELIKDLSARLAEECVNTVKAADLNRYDACAAKAAVFLALLGCECANKAAMAHKETGDAIEECEHDVLTTVLDITTHYMQLLREVAAISLEE